MHKNSMEKTEGSTAGMYSKYFVVDLVLNLLDMILIIDSYLPMCSFPWYSRTGQHQPRKNKQTE